MKDTYEFVIKPGNLIEFDGDTYFIPGVAYGAFRFSLIETVFSLIPQPIHGPGEKNCTFGVNYEKRRGKIVSEVIIRTPTYTYASHVVELPKKAIGLELKYGIVVPSSIYSYNSYNSYELFMVPIVWKSWVSEDLPKMFVSNNSLSPVPEQFAKLNNLKVITVNHEDYAIFDSPRALPDLLIVDCGPLFSYTWWLSEKARRASKQIVQSDRRISVINR